MKTLSLPQVFCVLLAVVLADAAVAASPTPQPAGDTLTVKLEQELWRGDLDGMIKRRVIRALVPYSKTMYFVDLGGTQRGISYDFMRAFEVDLNKNMNLGNLPAHVVFIPVSRAQLLPMLLAGEGKAKEAGLDPNLWFDNVERIAAREIGRETVQYVSNIDKYYIAYTLVQDEVERGLPRRTP
ncbi:MAG: hypothetical protein ABIT36_09610 [Steroidobacteraceae bacterium]